MIELELVGIHNDAEHLVLMGPDGERYRLEIDEALRAAVRRDRPQLEQVRTEGVVRPREIQVMIRSGSSAEDIAAEFAVPLETVRRYEGPVIAERQHVSQQARALTITRQPGAPVLADVVVDRLASRGVRTDSLEWDARRVAHEPWELVLRFVAGDRERAATWQVDLSARTVLALDDESRWLSETEWSPAAGARRHLSAVRGGRVYDVENDDPIDLAGPLAAVDAGLASSTDEGRPTDDTSGTGDADRTEALLDQLAVDRGVRQPVIDEADETDEAVREPMLWEDPPPAHPPASHPDERPDATILPVPAAATTSGANDEPPENAGADATRDEETEHAPRPRRRRRTSVPSWDEIVFGAKND
ncbi:DUF3071 domain-containing protein [Ruania alkalisoli]|uniref:DUF3071 domain-containing protein n=1 Tax=Ruania alkalisoli TaxID=2779775 RepID=A0A7M1SNG7_9MICO|nr:septation protein SepH [Ruania alkalisoli]QOR69116.1 DUF3071 domain-containing protein [Ruania alkalisoli]